MKQIVDQQDARARMFGVAAWAPWVLGLGWLVPFAAFSLGYDAIDKPIPAVGPGASMYLFGMLAGAGLLAVAIVYRANIAAWPVAVGGTAGGVIGMMLALAAQDSYAEDGFGMALFTFYILAPLVIVPAAVTMLVLASLRRFDGMIQTLWLWGSGMAAIWGVASLYHLATIQAQADYSREAHESPVGLSLVLAMLTIAGILRRRQDKC